MSEQPELITEDWLKQVGFKWHEIVRSPNKHWLLWLGGCMGKWTAAEDIGVELTMNDPRREEIEWHCWLRGDSSSRYHRFIHIRCLKTQRELIALIEGLTGQEWNPANNRYGSMYTPEQAEKMDKIDERLDRQILASRPKWYENEKDDSRAGALTDDLNYAIKHRETAKG